MPKIYVQSGLFEMIVQAHDGEGAALWAVHRFLEAMDSDSHTRQTDLAATIRCSEIGFGRSDGGEFLTSDVIQKYTELLSALTSLGLQC